MAKFTGSEMTASFGGVPVGCLTGIETSESADVYTAACAGVTYKVRAVGNIDASFTLTFLLDTTTHAAELAAFAAGSTGAFTCSTNGTLGPQYSAASSIAESLNTSVPVEGFVTATLVVGVDGALVVT
jgi:hypothetical protein